MEIVHGKSFKKPKYNNDCHPIIAGMISLQPKLLNTTKYINPLNKRSTVVMKLYFVFIYSSLICLYSYKIKDQAF